MPDLKREQFNKFLYHLSQSLDISESQYEKAKERYESIGRWLKRSDSLVAASAPDIFPQGSFRLGTIIKPFSGEEEFDIDLVCTLNFSKSEISQKRLKDIVGYEIKEYAREKTMNSPPEEGRRCWTLNYADGAKFHMDILPAVPDADSFRILLESRGASAEWTDNAISITDNTLPNYGIIDTDWLCSNPRGYGEWFKSRMKIRFDERRQILAESMQANIEDVPDYNVKTPLQRAIQILKRHRDILFAKDSKDKPISIIITTLAAHAYNNEVDLLDALISIVNGMPDYFSSKNGETWVANPVNPLENFADKWTVHPQREVKFKNWLLQVNSDLTKALHSDNIQGIGDLMKPRLGEKAVGEALKRFPQTTNLAPDYSVASRSTNYLSHFNVAHKKTPKWPWNPKDGQVVAVTGWVGRNGHRKKQFSSDSTPIPKNCSLSFKAKTNIRWPYKVYWQVVNTGPEASIANSLRGGFYDGIIEKGGRKRKESTSYSGMHWVECFIVKGGDCVARSGEFVVNIE